MQQSKLNIHIGEAATPEDAACMAELSIKRNPWAVVIKPGQDGQEVFRVFPTYKAAVAGLGSAGEDADVMKRLADGSLTTEY